MFDNKYHQWNSTRIKAIVDFYSHKFFYMKKVLDLGCGYGDMGGVLYRLGADVTGVDARQEHLKVVSKKFSGIKVIKADLDNNWPFGNQKFDLVLSLGLMCHLENYEQHLKTICAYATNLVLETAVCDSQDDQKCVIVNQDQKTYDLAYNGKGSYPSPAAIERVLKECGMNFKRIDHSKLNTPDYQYDWRPANDGSISHSKRKMWVCVKESSPIQFAPPGTVKPKYTPRSVMEQAKYHPPKMHKREESSPINKVASKDKKFVIVIPSYNNEKWCEQNINSVINQNYTNYRIIYTDDCSPDSTFEKASQLSASCNKITLIKNKIRLGAMENLYNMIHSCEDDEIIITVDGDDWLADNDVLSKLNQFYCNEDIWMTYGQYKNSTDGNTGCSNQYPINIINANSFRQHTWGASHLRTFYTWLFKKIKKEDFLKDNKFFAMTYDMAIMFPMLEISGTRSKFISDILYVYNLNNQINDHKVNAQLQRDLDVFIRAKQKYSKLENYTPKNKVGLLLIATGKYDIFLQDVITSADKNFLTNDSVTYYVLSDKNTEIKSNRKIVNINIEHKPFPFATADRFKHFTNNADTFVNEDYLYYSDVDVLFVDKIDKEILGDLVGVRHCGFINSIGTYETNPLSTAYIDPSKYKHYYGGGFNGGKRENYLEMAKWCYEAFEKDLANGIMPVWQDESLLNKYFSDHEPTVILSPAYHYPQGDISRFKKMWLPYDWEPKILLLDKDHAKLRY